MAISTRPYRTSTRKYERTCTIFEPWNIIVNLGTLNEHLRGSMHNCDQPAPEVKIEKRQG